MKNKYYTINGTQLDLVTAPTDFTGSVKYTDGSIYWYLNGNRHRIGGVAIEELNGIKEYWINGKFVIKEQHDLLCSIMKLKDLL